jgi:hypothetical protein
MFRSPAAIISIVFLVLLGVWWWQTDAFKSLATPDENLKMSNPTNFAEQGVITFNSPGNEPGVPYLVYEAPGQPALSRRLILDELSYCAFGSGATPCMALSVTLDKPLNGRKALVEGEEQNDVVLVRKLWVIEGEGPLPLTAVGRQFISWPQAMTLIRNCDVEVVAQSHSLDVNLKLKSGEELVAVEPRTDDVFPIVQEVSDKCGNIPQAME